jgi:hypothetical protein
MFATIDDARAFINSGTHEFRRGSSARYYECAWCKKGLRRRIKQVRTPHGGVGFQVHQNGKHDHVAPARRKNRRNTRAQLDAVRNAAPSLTAQQILLTHPDVDLDARRIRAIKSADTRKIRAKEWETWFNEHKQQDPANPSNGIAIARGQVTIAKTGELREYLVLSSRSLLERNASDKRCVHGQLSGDGNGKLIQRGHTLWKLSTTDMAHVEHTLAFVIMQGIEPTECIEAALWDIDRYIREHLSGGGLCAKAWMLDAAGTVKRAVRNFHAQTRPPIECSRVRTRAHPAHDDGGELKVGMCRRHVYDAVWVKIGELKKNGELPQDVDETEVLLFTHAHVVHTHTHPPTHTHTHTHTIPLIRVPFHVS